MGWCMTIFEKNPQGREGCAFFSKIVASGTLRVGQICVNADLMAQKFRMSRRRLLRKIFETTDFEGWAVGG